MKGRNWWQFVIIVMICLALTILSFAMFFKFYPLKMVWLILICVVDFIVGLGMTCLANAGRRKSKSHLLAKSFLQVVIYLVVIYALGIIAMFCLDKSLAINFWQEWIAFSLFLVPCYYIAIPVIVFFADGISADAAN